MVRIGGKSTARTEPLLLQKQTDVGFRFTRADNSIINETKGEIETRASSLASAFQRYLQSSVNNDQLLGYLEFDEPEFFGAFQISLPDDGSQVVNEKGRTIREDYLIRRWRSGRGAGIYKSMPNVQNAGEIWSLSKEARMNLVDQWAEALNREEIEQLHTTAHKYNKLVEMLQRKFREKDGAILKSKRIIGCTTTAAAKYTRDIHEAAPDVVLVEEAGEILESHVITALGQAAKQLILIGDHQ